MFGFRKWYTWLMEEKVKKISNWLGSGSINIFGLPFAGKDTQGKILADLFGGILMSSGDILRHDHGNKRVQEIMASGGIIPSELFKEVVVPFLSRKELAGKPLILSEVGRVQGEDRIVLKATEDSGHPTKAVVLLKLSDAEVWQRFDESRLEGDRGERADDKREVLQNRLNKFHEMVSPVIEFYRSLGMLVEINGDLPRDEVTKEILEDLSRRSLIAS